MVGGRCVHQRVLRRLQPFNTGRGGGDKGGGGMRLGASGQVKVMVAWQAKTYLADAGQDLSKSEGVLS